MRREIPATVTACGSDKTVATPSTSASVCVAEEDESVQSTHSNTTDPILVKRSRGRPKLSNTVKIRFLKKRVDSLRQKVRRLQKKAIIQTKLLETLQRDNQLQHTRLDSIDGCLAELVENQTRNKNRKTKKNFSLKIKEFSLLCIFIAQKPTATYEHNLLFHRLERLETG